MYFAILCVCKHESCMRACVLACVHLFVHSKLCAWARVCVCVCVVVLVHALKINGKICIYNELEYLLLQCHK